MRYAASLPYLLSANDPSGAFPDVSKALRDPDGLLAIGGDLSVTRLVNAYRHGIFPWYSQGEPILWWAPDPRTVLLPSALHISHSLAKLLRKRRFGVTFDRDFPAVIHQCAAQRQHDGTWLLPEMIRAYCTLHERGFAHSVEVWHTQKLVGGLYGVAIGRAFFGESMFSAADNASKIALVQLCHQLARGQFALIDCQVLTGHLMRMGAHLMSRAEFVTRLTAVRDLPCAVNVWDPAPLHFPLAQTDTL
ncbi:leucyl/phenylalanyl-tRNA--protein transferase [Rhodoferax sp. 4810]|uniref:Leucyl/phenylalanyl-tRNA--protein transferase n=1 Tax=Thiospirillum jenense TaxID=1653858 RepID=A0A839HB60_9GAMM|nr:leucyl/phenylalanyl-tRNA--protein transferase [Rhodoferax jenense]MBB1125971.1 leucyl/phenylalanyl-tRNA--protein transferase [Thiospirillum jenense]